MVIIKKKIKILETKKITKKQIKLPIEKKDYVE